MSHELCRFHDIHKRYAQRTLLNVESLALHAGQCLALTGQNGAGKTTLLKILAGLETPQQAQVSCHGETPRPWLRVRDRLRREVVYLHQFPYMFDTTVAANVAYGLARQGMAPMPRRQRAQQALAQVGLEHLSDADAKSLSGGERQRVALARALVLAPKIVLLDEPTASLDQAGRDQLIPLLQQLKQRGLSCAIVTHDVTTLALLPDSYLRLETGGLIPFTPPNRQPRYQGERKKGNLTLIHNSAWEGAHG